MSSSACAVVGSPQAIRADSVLPETPGAAGVERSGAGLSGRDWTAAAIMLALASFCAVFGFAVGQWVSAPIAGYPCAAEWAR